MLAMVTDRSLLIDESPRAGPLRCWYVNLEDGQDEVERKFAAARLHHKIEDDEIGGRLFVDGRDLQIIVAREVRTGFTIAEPVVEAVMATIQKLGIDLLMIDPFVRSHQINENDNALMHAVASIWSEIAYATDCCVLLAHHARKPGPGQRELTIHDSRGGSALVDAGRVGRVLNRMSDTMARKLKLGHPWRYFRVDDGKLNLAPPTEEARWRHLVSVNLDNRSSWDRDDGDSVGVVEPWQMPDPTANVSDDDTARALAALKGGEWRKDSQAKAWAGKAIAATLGWDSDDQQDKDAIKKLIAMWLKDGTIKVVIHKDSKRMPREFVVVKGGLDEEGPGDDGSAE
jgi:hypothetical protein